MQDPPGKKLTDEVKETILLMLGHQPNLSAVARLVGVHPGTLYEEKRKDPEWGEEVKKAMEIGYDGLEEEAIRRGRDGVPKPVFFQGERVATVQEYSDSLLKELLRAYRPTKFNPAAKVNVTADDKVNFTINIGKGDD